MNRIFLSVVVILCAQPGAGQAAPTSAQVQFFETKIRPLLVEQCQSCHGPRKQQGGLRLDTVQGFRAGGDSGALVTTGKVEESLFLRAIRHQGPKMPPKKQLAPAEVALLVEWVKQGAPWPEATAGLRKRGEITAEDRTFWAFQPPLDLAIPAVPHAHWSRTPVDHFLLARLESKKLVPVADASKHVLLRRASFDLTGLPPTPGEVEAFLADTRPDAWARVVDRLLASPAYGERWGRHWLDVVRYADTAGDNSDYPVPQLYLYRNGVLKAFNEDRPYDTFLREQLAGDLMPASSEEERRDRTLATGYLALSRRFGSYEDKRYQWYLTFEDSIENLGRTALGLSLSCARCHDHKFDPIPSEDYYALYGFFQSTRYPWPGIELDKVPRDLVPLDSPEDKAWALQQRTREHEQLDQEIRQLQAERDRGQGDRKKLDERLVRARKRREELAKAPLALPLAYAVVEGKRWVGNASVQLRGDPSRPGKQVPRRFLQILGGQELPSGTQGSGRLHLANWVADERNPLTARVMVNRIWQHHFGRGLVPTPNDFGRQGQPPSHPELLDWLARRFVESGWSIKQLHRLILLSRAYQLSSNESEAGLRVDPDNRLLWRFTPRRLDAEALRDTLLDLAGLLDRSVGGAHPFPPAAKWNYTQHNPFKAVYETDRRSVYLMTQRIQRHPYLALFDGADTNASTGARSTSTTPLQALYLMNDAFVHRLARGLADRLLRSESSDPGRIDQSFLLAFARLPTEDERATALEFLTQVRTKLRSGGQGDRERQVWESYARSVFLTSELVYIN